MSDHTPSLDQIRGRYCDGTTVQTGRLTGGEEFDRAIAKVRNEAKAEALREAADKFQTGDWLNVIQGNARVKIGNGQRVTDWLRARADRLVTDE